MTTINKIPSEVSSAIHNNRLVSKRVQELREKGFYVAERRMGAGGVFQFKTVGKETRIQIGYGHGRYNYAMCVIL